MRYLILVSLVTVFLISDVYATRSAVFIAYHRFGENIYPTTNIRLEQFEQHIRELKSGPYTVLPVLKYSMILVIGSTPSPRTV